MLYTKHHLCYLTHFIKIAVNSCDISAKTDSVMSWLSLLSAARQAESLQACQMLWQPQPLLGASSKVASTLPSPSPSQLTQLCSQVMGAMFASVVHELHFTCSWIILNKDPTVWLDRARLANTCIPPSFSWMTPTQGAAHPPLKGASPLNSLGSQSGLSDLWVPFKGRRVGYRCWLVCSI